MTYVRVCLLSPSILIFFPHLHRQLSNKKRLKPILLTVQMSLPINDLSYKNHNTYFFILQAKDKNLCFFWFYPRNHTKALFQCLFLVLQLKWGEECHWSIWPVHNIDSRIHKFSKKYNSSQSPHYVFDFRRG